MMGKRCKLVGCKSELTNINKTYCSIHEGVDLNEISKRNVGRKPER